MAQIGSGRVRVLINGVEVPVTNGTLCLDFVTHADGPRPHRHVREANGRLGPAVPIRLAPQAPAV